MFVRTRRNTTNGGNETVPFVKLDCGMLTSTIWDDYPARSLFITALLMMEPKEYRESVDQIEVRTLNNTGWSAPPDWYGFVPAAGIGIIKRAGDVEIEEGFAALERLGSPDPTSRSQDYEGRRLIRVDGGYLVLNFDKYRERDYGAAERMRRLRERRRVQANGVTVPPNITQAEADTEAEAYAEGMEALALEAEMEVQEEQLRLAEELSLSSQDDKIEASRKPRVKRASREEMHGRERFSRDLVENFTVTAKLREWAGRRAPSVNVDTETEDWQDHLRTNKYRTKIGPVADADASWRTWMKNAEKFHQERLAKNGPKKPDLNANYRPLVDETGQR